MDASNNLRTVVFDILNKLVKKNSGIDMNQIDLNADYFSLGFDSLIVVRIDRGIRKHFGLNIKMGAYYNECNTLGKLLNYILAHIDSDVASKLVILPMKQSAPVVHESVPRVAKMSPSPSDLSGIERVMADQIQAMMTIMHRQLDIIAAQGQLPLTLPDIPSMILPSDQSTEEKNETLSDESPPIKSRISDLRGMKFDEDVLSISQESFIKEFIPRYNARTSRSKAYASKSRPIFADWINTLGFRRSLKEIIYPIVSQRSAGSRFWDIDGNEYIDMACGYGVNFFGNNPPFIKEAIHAQIAQGYELAPQFDMMDEICSLIKELTGMERVAFCNTGSEAVMVAVRCAQTLTGRQQIALFTGSFHGNSDLVLNGMSLRYGHESALDIIRKNADDLAAVLVEPVQSRNPSLQPKEFLHELRKLTSEYGIMLIFDEMITGFRCHPGGAQAIFDVKADLVTYGKIIGGGMPIGVVAGKSEYMQVIDGGMWNYGDNSTPDPKIIFFGGTFCKHPLSMAATRAALQYMKDHGPALQERVSSLADKFVTAVNSLFQKESIRIKVSRFASQFIFEPTEIEKRQLIPPIDMGMLFYLLMHKGVYTWERHICFFSIAHTDADADSVFDSLTETVHELKQAGFPLFDARCHAISPSNVYQSDKIISLPLTEAQKQLWFLSQINENAIPAYTETAGIKLKGILNIDALNKAAQNLVMRHQSLRTTISEDGSCQNILPYMDGTFLVTDATAITPEEKIIFLDTWLLENSRIKLDLVNGPIFSFKLLKLSIDEYVLVLNVHHIAIDGMSVIILLKDLIRLYSDYAAGREPVSEHLEQFSDYKEWLDNYLCSKEAENSRRFWQEAFPSPITRLELPADFVRPSVFSFKGARHQRSLDPGLMEKLKGMGRKLGLTPFMTLMILYALLLHKLTRREEVTIGFPVSGRFFDGSDDIVGYCTQIVPFTSRYSADQTLSSYIENARAAIIASYEHQQFPFSHMIREIAIDQDLSRGSLLSSEFNLDQMVDLPSIEGLNLTIFDIPLSYVKYDINLDIIEVAGLYQLKFEYATDIFKKETVNRISDYFLILLQKAQDNLDEPLKKISLLMDEEQKKILFDWNQTHTQIPLNTPFHRLFEDQVAKTPDNLAAIFEEPSKGGSQITYRELNANANRLARILKENGVAVETLTAILANRSCRFLTAMIAIFKAGGAYLPLDPFHPAIRLKQVINESGISLIIAEKNFSNLLHEALAGLEEKRDFRIIWLEDILDSRTINEADDENLDVLVNGNAMAYVIFTSGSTGVPKGAIVQQNGMVNHLFTKIIDLNIEENDVIAQNASQCFDISVWQFLAALLKGGKVQIMNNETAHDPVALLGMTASRGVTILEVVPSLLRMMLMTIDNGAPVDIKKLRWLIPTGEALPPKLAVQWFGHFPDIPVLNAYGPTECSDDVSHFRIDKPPDPRMANTPIGRPIKNMRLYILDETLSPVPVGVPAELFVGGVGVGRGYLNRDDLTCKAFIPDPFDSSTGSRLYRTGDLARFLPDGNIVFLGRLDNQVKVRGFRIELAEIEAAIDRYPAVYENVVISVDDHLQMAQLAAYLVLNKGIDQEHGVIIRQLRQYLEDSLPEYMVPAYFVILDKIPLTGNGKIDRQSLPDPEKSGIGPDTEFKAPRSKMEKLLASIIAQVVNRDVVGIWDNYFSIGGDSIKAIQVVSRVQTEGYRLKLRDIFQYPTIAELALRLTRLTRAIDQSVVSGKVLPTPIQQWLLSKDNDKICHYNQAILINTGINLSEDSVKYAIEALFIHHDALRFTVVRNNQESVIFNCGIDLKPDFEICDINNLDNSASFIIEKTKKLQKSFSLVSGPLMKVVLFKLEGKDSLFFLIHHLSVDVISWRILIEDFKTAYEQHQKGQNIEMPAKTDSFKYWSLKLKEFGESSSLNSEKSYWEDMASLPSAKIIPDHVVKADFHKDTATSDFILSRAVTSLLTEKAHKAFHTNMNDLLLTALSRALRQWSGKDGWWISLEGHGRDSVVPEVCINRTVGWFTIEYPICLNQNDNNDGLDFEIKKVKESLRKIPNHGLGFGLLRTQSGHKGALSINPEISFNYIGSIDGEEIDNGYLIEDLPHADLIHPDMIRQYVLEIEGLIKDGCLNIKIHYNQHAFEAATINRLTLYFESAITQIISFCAMREVSELTPSDFTWPHLSLSELDQILAILRVQGSDLQDIYPLSPMQEGMLFHRLYEPESVAYFEQFTFVIQGELNIMLLESAWNMVLKHHDILRTLIIYKGVQRPLQVIKKLQEVEFNFSDISLEPKNSFLQIETFKEQDQKRYFDLSEEVLMRFNVFKLSDGKYKVIWSFHHIIMDGWCLGILIQDALTAYHALLHGIEPVFKPVPQYREYIRWLEKADRKLAIEYWAAYLEGFNHLTTLPRDITLTRDSSVASSKLQAFYSMSLDEKLTTMLEEIASSKQITINTLLQSVWGLLIGEYNGTEDAVFGAAVSGRPAEIHEVEKIVGLFLNTVPVRVKSSGYRQFIDLALAVQNDSLASEPYHYISIADIQTACGSGQPLLDHVFIFQNYPFNTVLEDLHKVFPVGFTFGEVESFEQTNFDLSIEVYQGNKLRFDIRYNQEVYSKDRIYDALKKIKIFCEAITQNPDITIAEIKKRVNTSIGMDDEAAFLEAALNITDDF